MRIPSLAPLLALAFIFAACDSVSTQPPFVAEPDSSFRLYSVSFWYDRPSTDAYTLDSLGNAVHMAGHLETLDTLRAVLPASDLARAKAILETTASRHPTQIPYPFQLFAYLDPTTGETLVDTERIDGGSSTTRTIRYADDSISSMFAHSAVRELPDSWTALDPVDSMLVALFHR
jgi:hypothetical protein